MANKIKHKVAEGETYGHLTVVNAEVPLTDEHGKTWRGCLCTCDCGTAEHPVLTAVPVQAVATGRVRSCGCKSGNAAEVDAKRMARQAAEQALSGTPFTVDSLRLRRRRR